MVRNRVLARIHRLMGILDEAFTNISDWLSLSPQDLSWKIRWRMRNDHNPLFVELQDKYKVKEYAARRGVGVAKTYFVTEDPEQIPFESLPDTYFIKANHGCKWNILCENKELFYYGDGEDLIGLKNKKKYKLSRRDAINYCKKWLSSVYSKKEWAYQFIPRKILVEEVLSQKGGGELYDFRCFTFNGHVRAIYLDSATYNIYNQLVFADSAWNELEFLNKGELQPHVFPEKPDNLDEIVNSAQRLGAGLDFARIDLYNTNRGVVLGEISIYPMAGKARTPTPDVSFNKWLGEPWELPVASK